MANLSAIGAQLLTNLPLLLTLLAALVAAVTARQRLTGRTRTLLISGLLVLLLATVVSTATPLLAGFLINRSAEVTEVQVVFFLYGIVTSLVWAAGVALLIAAVFSGRPATPPGAPYAGAYPAHGTAPGGPDPYAATPAPR